MGSLGYVFASLILAVAYSASAALVMGTGLHAQIVPLWVPAGIALAAVLRFGMGVLPGVFLGNLAFNFYLTSSWVDSLLAANLLSSLMIASGATLQTGLAKYLIDRFGANPLQPSHHHGLYRFILFAGLVTCTLNATLGTLSVYWIVESAGSAGFLNDWISWWMGDSFGAILVTPLVLALLTPRHEMRLKRWLRLVSQLSMVILAILALNHIFLSHLQTQLNRSFQQDIRMLDAQIKAVVQQNLSDLTSLESLVLPEGRPDPEAFRTRVLEIQARNPSVLAYSWDPLVPQQELETFEAETRRLLNRPDFAVYGASLHPEDPFVPVQFVEPLELNAPALGFNLLSLDDRRRWVLQAQRSGRPLATQIINLTQAPKEPGMLILHPVYQSQETNPLLGDKRLVGFMVGVFTVERMFRAALQQIGLQNIEFALSEQNVDQPFFTTAELPQQSPLYSRFLLDVAQQRWAIEAYAGLDYMAMHPASNAQLMQTLLVVVGCMGALLILGMHDRERNLMAQVNRRTQELAHQARHDDLTGLPNRFRLMEAIQQRLTFMPELPFSVLFIDLDRFKMINDSLGHQTGDKLLRLMTEGLSRRLIEGSELYRTGGDEFILIVNGDIPHAIQEAERFLHLCSRPVEVDEHHLQLTASIGISHYPEQGDSLDTLIKHADTAMYRAKARGKNCYEIYDQGLTTAAVHSFHLEQDLRVALKERQLVLHFQPQFNLKDTHLCGLEVLVRWQHPVKGLLPPGQFIDLAEETNLIVPMGWQIIEMACEQILMWQEMQLMVPPVAINISPQQLLEADFLEHINEILARYGIARSQFELEITESLIMQDPDYAIAQLHALREAGYRLALDDFGTGYSSLNRLKHLPLDRLKIDYSFTRDIGKNPRDEAIITTVIALGKSLNIEVLAEGVETQAQYDFLRAQGCDSVQGFMLGRPVPRHELELSRIA